MHKLGRALTDSIPCSWISKITTISRTEDGAHSRILIIGIHLTILGRELICVSHIVLIHHLERGQHVVPVQSKHPGEVK